VRPCTVNLWYVFLRYGERAACIVFYCCYLRLQSSAARHLMYNQPFVHTHMLTSASSRCVVLCCSRFPVALLMAVGYSLGSVLLAKCLMSPAASSRAS
jgi:predicted alpha/beta-fold hydrolase